MLRVIDLQGTLYIWF